MFLIITEIYLLLYRTHVRLVNKSRNVQIFSGFAINIGGRCGVIYVFQWLILFSFFTKNDSNVEIYIYIPNLKSFT